MPFGFRSAGVVKLLAVFTMLARPALAAAVPAPRGPLGQFWFPLLLGGAAAAMLFGGFVLTRAYARRRQLLEAELEAVRRQLAALDFYRAAMLSIDDAIVATDAAGIVKLINSAAGRLTGSAIEKASGCPIDTILLLSGENSPEPLESPVSRTLRQGTPTGPVTLQLQSGSGGRAIPIECAAVPVRNRQGVLEGAVFVFCDISERKRAEARTQLLAAIVDSSQDAVIGKTLDGLITTWNQGAELIFGYSAAEIVGASISRLIPPGRANDMALILDRIRQGERVDHYETQRLTKDGRLIDVSLTISPVRDETGRIIGASKIARDVTAQREVEERLRQSQKMEAIGHLAGGIAHDFNNLLTVINGYSKLLLQQHPLPPPSAAAPPGGGSASLWQKKVEQIGAAGERAAALTQHLLAFSRKQVLQPKAVDLNQMVHHAQPLLRRLIRADVQITVQLAEGIPSVEVDPAQLEQVLMNLVINASEAMPHGGTLTIETQSAVLDQEYVRLHPEVTPGRYLLLAVSDTGTGIDPANRRYIFEPFYTTKPGTGTGLGLSTVYGIVKQSGGHIAVYSEPGVGTTFRTYLRVAPGEAFRTLAEPPAAVTSLRGSERVLVVEDEPRLREYTSLVLAELGYQVLEAGDGAEALALVRSSSLTTGALPISLLVTDVVMPSMNGRDLAEALRGLISSLRVLYISGYTENAIVQGGILDPGLHFLAKPFSPADLALKVRQVLDAPVRPVSILVVDDDEALRNFASLILTEAGYAVTLASSGEQAIALCRRQPVDLLITDMKMEGLDGLEVVAKLARELAHVRVIVMSGAFGGDIMNAALKMGAGEAILKPFQPAELLQAVRRVLG